MKIRKIKSHNKVRTELIVKHRKFWNTFHNVSGRTIDYFPYKLYVSWKLAILKLKNRSKL